MDLCVSKPWTLCWVTIPDSCPKESPNEVEERMNKYQVIMYIWRETNLKISTTRRERTSQGIVNHFLCYQIRRNKPASSTIFTNSKDNLNQKFRVSWNDSNVPLPPGWCLIWSYIYYRGAMLVRTFQEIWDPNLAHIIYNIKHNHHCLLNNLDDILLHKIPVYHGQPLPPSCPNAKIFHEYTNHDFVDGMDWSKINKSPENL